MTSPSVLCTGQVAHVRVVPFLRLNREQLAAEELELGRVAVESLAYEPIPVTTEGGW